MIAIGQLVPSVLFKATNGISTTFEHYRGKWIVLYFYPKDATPGCTIEGCDFRDNDKNFSFLDAIIFGISRDNISSHERFKMKQQFPFELISDVDETLCELFGVMKQKAMYGKVMMGIERSTFIIDPCGVVRYIWRNVKVKGHVDEVLQVLSMLFNETKDSFN